MKTSPYAPIWRDLKLGVQVDVSGIPDPGPAPDFGATFAAMAELEAGAIANPDEGRPVGHYWLRNPEIAPEALRASIDETRARCLSLALAARKEGRWHDVLVLGIGGSALGPQFLSDALSEPHAAMRLHFLDNTDPDGLARILGPLDLEETLVVCISKSGTTPETRNALVEVEAAYARAEVELAPRAIAISQEGSALWNKAEGWRARLPMWDWVGGRTSVTSAVGLLPLALQGIDVDDLLDGAAAMDTHTRIPDLEQNPAAMLAWAWERATGGAARRAMVMLPYRDRLVLLSRYLQQLVMESIGKEQDLQGKIVHQGLTVYGNKGSTDQHAYVQQLRDGPDDVFVTFIAVLDDGYHGAEDVEPGIDAGDYLQGLMLGTSRALSSRGRGVIRITLHEIDARRLGALIALYERAVGFYAARMGINAYHQPGVEAGKKAASAVLSLKAPLLAALDDTPRTLVELAERASVADLDAATAILQRLAVNERGVVWDAGRTPAEDRFSRR